MCFIECLEEKWIQLCKYHAYKFVNALKITIQQSSYNRKAHIQFAFYWNMIIPRKWLSCITIFSINLKEIIKFQEMLKNIRNI